MRKVILKHIAVDAELFKKFEGLKEQAAKNLGFKRLSFNQYMSVVYQQLKNNDNA